MLQGHGNSKSRNNLRSPHAHNIQEDSKLYKKKYEESKQMLKQQKRINEHLQQKIKELESQVVQYQNHIAKQDRQLEKKQEINEVLLDRIKCLKGALVDKESKKNGDDTNYDEKNYTKSGKSSMSNDEGGVALGKNQPVVGGYFGSIFK